MRRRVLLDVDGVLADFLSATFEFLRDWTGRSWTTMDLMSWEIFDHPELLSFKERGYEQWRTQGFCGTLQPYQGAQAAVASMQEVADVYILTSPMDSLYWVHERDAWLKQHFGINRKNIIHTSAKYVCSGDVLVDDRHDNIVQWLEHHPEGLGVLWAHKYNDGLALPTGAVRTASWEDLVGMVRDIARKPAR